MQCWTAGGWCCVDGGGQLDLQGCSPLPRLLICECWRVSGSGAPELTLFKALIFFCQQNTTKAPQTPGYIPLSSSVTTPAVAGKSVTPVSVLCVGSTESEGVDPLQCCSVCRLLQEPASPARRGDTGGDRDRRGTRDICDTPQHRRPPPQAPGGWRLDGIVSCIHGISKTLSSLSP